MIRIKTTGSNEYNLVVDKLEKVLEGVQIVVEITATGYKIETLV